jgi:hypothetical protein
MVHHLMINMRCVLNNTYYHIYRIRTHFQILINNTFIIQDLFH